MKHQTRSDEDLVPMSTTKSTFMEWQMDSLQEYLSNPTPLFYITPKVNVLKRFVGVVQQDSLIKSPKIKNSTSDGVVMQDSPILYDSYKDNNIKVRSSWKCGSSHTKSRRSAPSFQDSHKGQIIPNLFLYKVELISTTHGKRMTPLSAI
jgi:hypothetical protein